MPDSEGKLQSRIPDVDSRGISNVDSRRGLVVLKLVAYLSLLQASVMFVYTVFFSLNRNASSVLFEKLKFFNDYIPALHRYAAGLAARRRLDEIPASFSIHLFNALLEILILLVLGSLLFHTIRYHKIRAPKARGLGVKKNIIYLSVLLFLSYISLNVFFAIDNDPVQRFYGTLLGTCITVPMFNIFLFLILYARFWERHYGRSNSSPAKFGLRGWK